MKSEAEMAKEVLEGFNGAPYKITSPHPESYMATIKPKWYVSCLDGAYYSAMVHAQSAWSDKDGIIWVDSARFGNTTDWVEDAYGEKGAVKAIDIDYTDLSVDEVQERLKAFPWVYSRIETYKQVLSDASDRTGVMLAMVCEGKKGISWLLFRGRVPTDRPGGLETGLRKTIEALKEAYDLTEREAAYRR